MEAGHSYIFAFDSPAYAEGYDRIFRKKVKNETPPDNEIRQRGSVQKTDQQAPQKGSAKPKSTRRIYRKTKIREA